MAQEINALDEAIRELEQRKKRLMSTLGHYMLFQDRHVPVQQIKLKSECWYIPLEWQQPESCCRQWLQHTDVMFTGIHIDPTELVPPLHSAVPYTMELGAYTDDRAATAAHPVECTPDAGWALPVQLCAGRDGRHHTP